MGPTRYRPIGPYFDRTLGLLRSAIFIQIDMSKTPVPQGFSVSWLKVPVLQGLWRVESRCARGIFRRFLKVIVTLRKG